MRTTVLVSVLALAACDSLADNEFVGEPLITLAGSFVVTPGASAPADPIGGVALLWQDARGAGGPGAAVMALPVAVEFPAAFRVAVPTPPPDAARFQLDNIELAEAYVYVVTDATAPRPQPRGSDRVHALVWATTDVADGSLAADYLGGAVAAGYHLRQFTASTTPGAAQQQMIARCTGAGEPAAACTARRAYQLAPIADNDPLLVDVLP